MSSNGGRRQLSSPIKTLLLGLLFVVPFYTALLLFYLIGFINSFVFLGVLLLMIVVAVVILLLFRKHKLILQTAFFTIIITGILFGYEARLLNYESVTYLVDSYREPEELLPNTNLYILLVGSHDIHYIQENDMLMRTLEANDISPLEIAEVDNADKYAFKTTDMLDFFTFKKGAFQKMGHNVQHFIGEDLPFLNEFLKRDNLYGDSAGLILGLYAFMDRGHLKNNIPLGVTGTIERNGDVMEVGGIQAKMMIAAQNNFPHIIIPAANLQEAEQVKREASLSINIIPVNHINEAVDAINNLNNNSK